MKDYWFFVFASAPNAPCIVQAIFPPEMLTEALEFSSEANGYREIRKATWSFGEVPEYSETESI